MHFAASSIGGGIPLHVPVRDCHPDGLCLLGNPAPVHMTADAAARSARAASALAKSMAAVPDGERAGIWLAARHEPDYPAAGWYLQLLVTGAEVAALVAALRGMPAVDQKAKAPLRASRFPPPEIRNTRGRDPG